jgi:hypothetical protein
MWAAATKSATKPKAKSKTKKSHSARAGANRRNTKKSTGPRTEEGKSKSRLSELKHGMTAQTVLLPGNDGQALLAAISARRFAASQ